MRAYKVKRLIAVLAEPRAGSANTTGRRIRRHTVYTTRIFTPAEVLGQEVQPMPEAGTLLSLGTGTLREADYGRRCARRTEAGRQSRLRASEVGEGWRSITCRIPPATPLRESSKGEG